MKREGTETAGMRAAYCKKLRVYGVVQGVGFRPFAHNLAARLGLAGTVCNCGPFVEILIEGGERQLAAFLDALKTAAPVRAIIRRVEEQDVPPRGFDGFAILPSIQSAENGDETAARDTFVPPDLAVCPDCARELFDPRDRRYLHPFINCVNCGPRLTILDAMPYDRERTSMARFAMCPDCAREYGDTDNRRYHAQPVCCPDCGPRLRTLPKLEGDPIKAVRTVLRQGGIAAVKGIGGYHLCCDAANGKAVARLRAIKGRETKPFAVMARDLGTARRLCETDACAEELLQSPARPIVLLKKRADAVICAGVAPGNPNVGVMLPYAPVQLLLFDAPDGLAFPGCLVMTSGNRSGQPICIDDGEAQTELAPLCDIVLLHDREIRLRADDSVAAVYRGAPMLIRRSRGYAPLPFSLPGAPEGRAAFAAGGELKNTFCLVKGGTFYPSPYIGDLSDERAVRVLDDARLRMQWLLRIEPKAAACDLHPGYSSARYARSLGLPVLGVQHHFAHVLACMVDNGAQGDVIGVSFDGTGYGEDGTLWGGEFLRVSNAGFERLGSLAPFALAGGDAASCEGWRPAVPLLTGAFGGEAEEIAQRLSICDEKAWAAQQFMIKYNVNCAVSTSAGRLFDAAAALLGIKARSTFEGEAAIALQFAAERAAEPAFRAEPVIVGEEPFRLETAELFRRLAEGRLQGEDVAALARAFHEALAGMVLAGCLRCREKTGLSRVALSGGVFQNLLLLGLCEDRLCAAGFEVLVHRQIPANDGGIAVGQAAYALYADEKQFKQPD